MKGKKIILITICAVLAAAAVTLAIVIPLAKKSSGTEKTKLAVAFVALPESQSSAIESQLSSFSGTYTFSSYATPEELGERERARLDAIITVDGIWAEKIFESLPEKTKKKSALPQSSTRGFTRAISSAAGKSGNTVTRLPILIDSEEILFDQSLLRTTRTTKLENWQDIEVFAAKAEADQKIVFAGKNPRALCSVLTLLTESFSGAEAVEKIRLALISSEDIAETVEKLSETPDAPLYAATHTLARWQKQGLIPQSVFSLEERDVRALMYSRNAAVVITSLTHHRSIDYTTISRYTSLPLFTEQKSPFTPSFRLLEERRLVSPWIVAVPLSASKVLKEDLEKLTDIPAQEALSKNTGLAPVLANCRTPDVQADDVRFWVAATGKPLASLADSAFTSQEQREAFAKTVSAYIRRLNY